ncbi:MAG: hypothetical protein EOP34_03250 [Rickettsiales bacterium]|nr:MAG: hypothetical protein EOP34_03250 [Rickettsiales bacterium]
MANLDLYKTCVDVCIDTVKSSSKNITKSALVSFIDFYEIKVLTFYDSYFQKHSTIDNKLFPYFRL